MKFEELLEGMKNMKMSFDVLNGRWFKLRIQRWLAFIFVSNPPLANVFMRNRHPQPYNHKENVDPHYE